MGFEVVYIYHEKIDGGYDKEETKTFKKKVGDPFEEVPMEKLAASIMSQLARRDIWIIDAEVFELTKKQISFKETKGGLILKNKKYSFEGSVDSSFIVAQEVEEKTQKQQEVVPTHQLIKKQEESQQISEQSLPKKPVGWITFLPELTQLQSASRYKLTREKNYAVYKRRFKPSGIGEEYTIEDDIGRIITVSDDYFVPANINLVADKELNFTKKQEVPSDNLLFWSSEEDLDVPDIRKAT
ncbi:MAG: hypothetical protein EKK64_10480 [Neisseriaceae bacterium]|nr:MAG: hypothetical protein EKK64_10480 [Neisseriaceae bacterium]